MSFRCTECETTHKTFNAAAQCHWGIGGVEEVTAEEAVAEYEAAKVFAAERHAALAAFDAEFLPNSRLAQALSHAGVKV